MNHQLARVVNLHITFAMLTLIHYTDVEDIPAMNSTLCSFFRFWSKSGKHS